VRHALLYPNRHNRGAFTLVELVLNLALITLLMGAMGSTLLIATHGISQSDSPVQQTAAAHGVLERLAVDLHTAIAIPMRAAHDVRFTVFDRDNDGNSETIEYSWSGSPGDPLTRTFNNDPAVVMADNVHEFDLRYGLRDTSHEQSATQVTVGAEQTIASFDSWTGLLSILDDYDVTPAKLVSTSFDISPPINATELELTQAVIMLGRKGIPGGNDGYSIAVHPNLLAGGKDQPAPTPIGSPVLFSSSSIPSSYQYTPIPMNGITITDLSQSRYWLVLRGTTGSSVFAQGAYNLLGFPNGVTLRWSKNGAVSWEPLLESLLVRDLRFSLYGKYKTNTIQRLTIIRSNLIQVDMVLRIGAEPHSRGQTSVQILNEPLVNSQMLEETS